jgi:hypothetical protein
MHVSLVFDVILTFFRVSVSVSVPVDFELTGLSVPSTLSSRRSFNGDGGIAWPAWVAMVVLVAVIVGTEAGFVVVSIDLPNSSDL